ncbi:MAG: hypothetical protein LBR75_05315, partial [Prevotellaceae bacterium]|nr:hypothetical protein [Prevotellaceae bacterium]
TTGAKTDPKGAATGYGRITRGGSYNENGAREGCVTCRNEGNIDTWTRGSNYGIRLACSVSDN